MPALSKPKDALSADEDEDGSRGAVIKSNSMGVKPIIFIPKIAVFMKQNFKRTIHEIIGKYANAIQKYVTVIGDLIRKQEENMRQIKESEKALETVKCVAKCWAEKKTMETYSLVRDDLFVKTSIPPNDSVILWLGANVAAKYKLEDAENFLFKRIKCLKNAIGIRQKDIQFLRKQMTALQVTMTRIYNFGFMKTEKANKTE